MSEPRQYSNTAMDTDPYPSSQIQLGCGGYRSTKCLRGKEVVVTKHWCLTSDTLRRCRSWSVGTAIRVVPATPCTTCLCRARESAVADLALCTSVPHNSVRNLVAVSEMTAGCLNIPHKLHVHTQKCTRSLHMYAYTSIYRTPPCGDQDCNNSICPCINEN